MLKERQELLRWKSDVLALRVEIRFQRLLRALKAYNPNQPRVPAGNSDGGQWTSEGIGQEIQNGGYGCTYPHCRFTIADHG